MANGRCDNCGKRVVDETRWDEWTSRDGKIVKVLTLCRACFDAYPAYAARP